MAPVRRVLITGSRGWKDRTTIWTALKTELDRSPDELVVVHGGAQGADDIADRWASGMNQEGWPVWGEVHRPDYDQYLPKFAPLRRNEHMVRLGADICLAFPLEGGTGTRHCMSRAYAAGIPVINFGYQPYTHQAQEYAAAYG